MSTNIKHLQVCNPFATINSYFMKHPKWGFCNVDINIEKWNFIKNANEEILDKLKNFESMTWNEIVGSSGGKNKGNNNHFVQKDFLSDEAKHELKKLNYNSIQEIFSLRLTGKQRLYGMIDEKTGFFNILWMDKIHEICPLKK